MAEYRIDDLARAAGTSVRNVRAYQDRGLLPAPVRRGRVAIYTDGHLGRLRLILQLLGRGYTLAQIKEIVDAWEQGRDLGEALGLEQALAQPWSDETPTRMSLAEARRAFGRDATGEHLKRMVELGLVARRGMQLEVRSPRLVQAGRELTAAGVPASEVLDLAEALRGYTDAIAELFLATIQRYVVDVHGPEWVPEAGELRELTDLVERLRPLARSATAASLALSLEQAFPAFVERIARHLHR